MALPAALSSAAVAREEVAVDGGVAVAGDCSVVDISRLSGSLRLDCSSTVVTVGAVRWGLW